MRVSLLLSLLFLAGCALPAPLSEGVMFTDGDYGQARRVPFTSPRSPSTFRAAAGVGASASFYPPSFGQELAARQGHEVADRQNGFYQVSLPMPQFGLGIADWGAVAFSPGAGFFGFSLNGTARLFGAVYITANATPFPPQGEFILQQRLLRAGGSGLSAGLFYRREFQDDDLYLSTDGPVGVDVVGARTAFRFDGGWLRLQGYTSLGYAPDFGMPVFGVGLMHTL